MNASKGTRSAGRSRRLLTQADRERGALPLARRMALLEEVFELERLLGRGPKAGKIGSPTKPGGEEAELPVREYAGPKL